MSPIDAHTTTFGRLADVLVYLQAHPVTPIQFACAGLRFATTLDQLAEPSEGDGLRGQLHSATALLLALAKFGECLKYGLTLRLHLDVGASDTRVSFSYFRGEEGDHDAREDMSRWFVVDVLALAPEFRAQVIVWLPDERDDVQRPPDERRRIVL